MQYIIIIDFNKYQVHEKQNNKKRLGSWLENYYLFSCKV